MVGTSIAHYHITAKLGQGGMGEVYRATDTKLERDVAIKVLPESFALDRERLARFEREAKTLAALNHPNIAGIFGLEETGTSQALVLELVDGDDLSDVLKRGLLPIEEALDICKQIAEALEAAHEKGIIHRDLKPGNVKITSDGLVKVLDFGLAKSALGNDSDFDADSPTITADYTMPGTLLGTAGYMSPEQAKGKTVDKRSDIWSFGVVLFECLTGERLFAGETVTDSIGALLHRDIDWAQLPPPTPPAIDLLLRKCLARDRKRRLPDIGAARLDLEQAIADPNSSFIRLTEGALSESQSGNGLARPVVAGWVFLVTVVAVALTWHLKPLPEVEPKKVRWLRLGLEENQRLWLHWGTAIALSPDGSSFAYISRSEDENGSDTRYLFLKRFNEREAIRLDETKDVSRFAFSPSGRWIAFSDGQSLQKIPVGGGSATSICEENRIRAIDWSDEDWILINSEFNKGEDTGKLFRVSVSDGKSEPITSLERRETMHRAPQLLSGGQSLLFSSMISGYFETASIKAMRLSEGEPVTVVERGYGGRYVSSGHLLYLDQGSLFAVPFDLDSLTVSGERRLIISRVGNGENGDAHYAVSNDGTLIYVEEDLFMGNRFELKWVDQDGNSQVLAPADDYGDFAFSPDGTRLAYVVTQREQEDLWMLDTERGYPSRVRLTDDRASKRSLVWSPNGKSIVYTSNLNGVPELYWKHVDDLEPPKRLLQSEYLMATSWHPDGKYLLVVEQQPGLDTDIRAMELQGDDENGWIVGELTDVQSTRFRELHPQFSPDGNWIAYQFHDSGDPQVYVLPFPWEGRGRGERIATLVGRTNWPLWSGTDQELIFGNRANGRIGQIFRVKYTVEKGAFSYGDPTPWQGANFFQETALRGFDLDSSNNRLLVRRQEEKDGEQESEAPPIIMVENFFDYLGEKVPINSK